MQILEEFSRIFARRVDICGMNYLTEASGSPYIGAFKSMVRYLGLIPLALPSLIIPFLAASFLRANRRHVDFALVCRLTTIAALIWVFIATIEAPPAMVALEAGLPPTLDMNCLVDPFCRWVLFCVPSMPTLTVILIGWLKYSRK